MLNAIFGPRKRRTHRVEVSIPARLRYAAAKAAPIRVESLSLHGLRAEARVPLRRGDLVSIELPEIGPTTARVAWTSDGRFGAMFRKAVDVRNCVR